jgi:hypothetical protein
LALSLNARAIVLNLNPVAGIIITSQIRRLGIFCRNYEHRDEFLK